MSELYAVAMSRADWQECIHGMAGLAQYADAMATASDATEQERKENMVYWGKLTRINRAIGEQLDRPIVGAPQNIDHILRELLKAKDRIAELEKQIANPPRQESAPQTNLDLMAKQLGALVALRAKAQS